MKSSYCIKVKKKHDPIVERIQHPRYVNHYGYVVHKSGRCREVYFSGNKIIDWDEKIDGCEIKLSKFSWFMTALIAVLFFYPWVRYLMGVL